jgi:hypothetical protein
MRELNLEEVGHVAGAGVCYDPCKCTCECPPTPTPTKKKSNNGIGNGEENAAPPGNSASNQFKFGNATDLDENFGR